MPLDVLDGRRVVAGLGHAHRSARQVQQAAPWRAIAHRDLLADQDSPSVVQPDRTFVEETVVESAEQDAVVDGARPVLAVHADMRSVESHVFAEHECPEIAEGTAELVRTGDSPLEFRVARRSSEPHVRIEAKRCKDALVGGFGKLDVQQFAHETVSEFGVAKRGCKPWRQLPDGMGAQELGVLLHGLRHRVDVVARRGANRPEFAVTGQVHERVLGRWRGIGHPMRTEESTKIVLGLGKSD